jgi:hypothetical protein
MWIRRILASEKKWDNTVNFIETVMTLSENLFCSSHFLYVGSPDIDINADAKRKMTCYLLVFVRSKFFLALLSTLKPIFTGNVPHFVQPQPTPD